MAGVKRLLLIRKKDVRANLIDSSGFTQFVKQEPIPITPLAWSDEQGVSHYAYLLEELKLKDLEALQEFENKNHGATVLAFRKFGKKPNVTEETVEEALAAVGLGVNELVE